MPACFSANLTFLFGEVPFEKRFVAAAAAGFKHVECLFPYAWNPQYLRSELDENGLRMEIFTMVPGDFAGGDRGLLTNPACRSEFHHALDRTLNYARTLGCPRVHAMLGNRPPDLPPEAVRAAVIENLCYAAPRAAQAGVTLCIEALNPFDFPNFFLSQSADAFAILKEVNEPNVKFEFDCYHLQITEGNLMYTFLEHVDEIGHVQIAEVPGRHQPGTGEINYSYVLRTIRQSSYSGFVGLEYIPLGSTEEALTWLPRDARGDAAWTAEPGRPSMVQEAKQ